MCRTHIHLTLTQVRYGENPYSITMASLICHHAVWLLLERAVGSSARAVGNWEAFFIMNAKRKKELAFHIKSDDYFGTLAVILSLVKDVPEKADQVNNKAILTELIDDLVFLQSIIGLYRNIDFWFIKSLDEIEVNHLLNPTSILAKLTHLTGACRQMCKSRRIESN